MIEIHLLSLIALGLSSFSLGVVVCNLIRGPRG